MPINKTEKGQALILITLAAVALFAFAALAIDGSRVYSDKRHAQNAADTASMAGALAYTRAEDDEEDDFDDIIENAAQLRATSNSYDDNGTTNEVTISSPDVPFGVCPVGVDGKDIKVDIVSHLNTTLARVIGRNQVTSAVTATARACRPFHDTPFYGNAIVSLAPNGTGFDANGNADFDVTGGGVYSNSTDPDAAVACGGSADMTAPSVTVVGGVDISGCSTLTAPSPNLDLNATQINYSNYAALFPREPTCNGTASFSGGVWYPEAGKDGSEVVFSGNMNFAPGIYCVTNSPGNAVDTLSGSGVTFFIDVVNFEMKLNGDGEGMTGLTATTSGEYEGVLFYLAPQVDAYGNLLNTQALDLRGNGNADVVGTIYAPSADVTMFGNSGTGAINSQVIAYQVDTGGTADIVVDFDPNDGYKPALDGVMSQLR